MGTKTSVKDETAETIRALRDHYADRLTEWEEEFLLSLESRLAAKIELSLAQQTALDRVWDRVTARGTDSGSSAIRRAAKGIATAALAFLLAWPAGTWGQKPDAAAADAEALRPPTLSEFQAMAEEGRFVGRYGFVCPQGSGTINAFGRADDPADPEWSVTLLSWRQEAPWLVAHYTTGADGYAHLAWADLDGDGVYEIALTAMSREAGAPCQTKPSLSRRWF